METKGLCLVSNQISHSLHIDYTDCLWRGWEEVVLYRSAGVLVLLHSKN